MTASTRNIQKYFISKHLTTFLKLFIALIIITIPQLSFSDDQVRPNNDILKPIQVASARDNVTNNTSHSNTGVLNNEEVNKEKRKHLDIRSHVKEKSKRLMTALDQGEDISAHEQHFNEAIDAMESDIASEDERFKKIEEKLRTIGSSRHQLKHQQFMEMRKENIAEMRRYLKEVREAQRSGNKENFRQKLRNFDEYLHRTAPKDEYQVKSSERLPWSIKQPGEVLLLGDSSGIPQGANVTTSTAQPTADDLSQTTDVQITPEITALAQSLDNNPLKIFRYVYNNYDYVPYLRFHERIA